MKVKVLTEFIFENCYKQIGFTNKDSNYSLKKAKKKSFGNTFYFFKIPDPKKAKEYHELILKNKDKKIGKLSKTLVKPTNGDIKSVTAEYPKSYSKLPKPIKQSKITTQQSKTIENPKIVDIE